MAAQNLGPMVQHESRTDSDLFMAESAETHRLLGSGPGEATDEVATDGVSTGWDGLADFEALPRWRQPSVYWLLVPYLVSTLAFGSILVPKLNLILNLVCQRYFANQQIQHPPDQSFSPVLLQDDNPQCRNPEVQKHVATFMLVLNFCTNLCSAFAASRLGHLSDRYGRRRLLALVSCGGLLGELITILVAKYPQTADYRWLILGAVFDGITGSFTAASILTQSYTSDCTPPSKRGVAIGYIHACFFSGLALGQFLGGEIVKLTGSLMSIFYICLGAHIIFIITVRFIIPESLSKKKQLAAREKHRKYNKEQKEREASWLALAREKNPFAALSVLWPRGRGTSTRLRINLVVLATIDTIIMGIALAAGPVFILYAQYTFNWHTPESSRLIGGVSLGRAFVLMVVIPIINYIFRVRAAAKLGRESGVVLLDEVGGADHVDTWILRFALLSDIIGHVGCTFARTPVIFVGSTMVTTFGGLGSATIQSVVTKHIPQHIIGRVLGAIGMLQALVKCIGPVMFNGLYAATIATYPQAIFVALTGLFGFALSCSFLITPHVHWEEHLEEQEDETLNRRVPDTFGTDNINLSLDEDEMRY